MTLPTIETFEVAKNIIEKYEKIKLKNNKNLISIYSNDNISFWELFKPILNIYIIPGINSNSKEYGYFSSLLRVLKHFFKKKLPVTSPNKFSRSNNFDTVFLGFSPYIANDIYTPLFQEYNQNNLNNRFIHLTDDVNSNNFTHGILEYWTSDLQKELKKELKKINDKATIIYIFKNLNYILKQNITLKQFILIHIWVRYIFIKKYIHYYILANYFIHNNTIQKFVEIDISDPRSRVFSLIGKRKNIPTITLQFGFYYKDSYEWFYTISDKIIVWGTWFKNLFINFYKIDAKKIIITGSPRFDNLIKYNNDNKNISNKSVLIISSYEIKGYNKISNTIKFSDYLKSTIEILINNDYKVFIKIHPLEKQNDYLNSFKQSKLKFINLSEFNSIIEQVDFVLTHGSSLTFNVLIKNKPILYPIGKEIVWWDDIFADEKFGIGFENVQKLQNILTAISIDSSNLKKDYKNKLNKYIFIDSDSASKKIINYLSNFSSSKNN